MTKPDINFTIRQLEYFVAVAASGSITGGARLVHASDSAVSDAIGVLEQSLGAELFRRRRSKGVNLTSDGLALLPLARGLLTEAERLGASVGSSPTAASGPVRLGAGSTLSSVVIPPLIALATERIPAVAIELVVADLPSLLSMVDSAELDIVLAFDIDLPPEYSVQKLAATEACVVVSSSHPLAAREQVDLAELEDEPMVLLDIAASRVHTLELMSGRGISPSIVRRVSDYELCRSLVGEGIGYSLLMRRSIPGSTWGGTEVRYLSISPRPRKVEVVAATSMESPRPPRVDAVLALAAELGSRVQRQFGSSAT